MARKNKLMEELPKVTKLALHPEETKKINLLEKSQAFDDKCKILARKA
jgi:hypothetical protein